MNPFDAKFLTYKEKLDLFLKAGKFLSSGDYLFDSDFFSDQNKSWYTFVGFREIQQRIDNEIKYYLIGILQSDEGLVREISLQLVIEYFEDKERAFVSR
ncbi:MAG TPA: hypothetical protein VNB90_12540 [Cytophagaceae bacterium]|jgi:hypothetical protein|nr:hypothetical protein [Cytophagaceae bacterium]